MTYIQLINALADIGAVAPDHEAAEILRLKFNKSREWCLSNRNTKLPDEIAAILELRKTGIPLQYILGESWFYGYRFLVTPDCLIPQPDTEHTVALALKYLPTNGKLLDLCAGSGCIPIAVLNESPAVSASALEISEGAIRISAQNAELHAVNDRLNIIKADVLRDDITSFISEADVITSNPPYINTDVIATLSEEVKHEPFIALDGGSDGMMFYRHFIRTLAPHMKSDAVMLLEIGYDQADRISELCLQNGFSCRLHKDFGGNFRVAEVRKI